MSKNFKKYYLNICLIKKTLYKYYILHYQIVVTIMRSGMVLTNHSNIFLKIYIYYCA